MSQKLNLQALKSNAKKYDKKEKVQLNNDFHVYVYKHFAPSKVVDMLVELLTDYEESKKQKLGLESISRQDWLYFMIIKTFTDLNISPVLKNKIATYLQIRDSDIYPLLTFAFPKESYERVVKMMNSIDNQLGELKNFDQNKLQEIVENVSALEETKEVPQKES